MKTYVVGGAVRDRLLGLPVVDRDHVVVGATVDEMLAAGFRPVGRDFPVFLHPVTHEEYALARTERKVGPGYSGFVFHADPSVTLEADLERRDLTINAMADDEATGEVIDPFGGRLDLDARRFRHVGAAFSEDPVRLLRVARFAARFVDFTIAPDTLVLLRGMAAAGEVDALVPERVWQEVARGLMEARPSRMLSTLRDADALARVLPEIDRLFADGVVRDAMLRSLDRAAASGAALEIRFAIVVSAIAPWPAAEAAIRALSARVAVPGAARDLAIVVARERGALMAAPRDPGVVVAAMERSDGFRRAARFADAVAAIACTIDDPDVRSAFVAATTDASTAARGVDVGAIARAARFDPARIAADTRAARIAAVAAAVAATVAAAVAAVKGAP